MVTLWEGEIKASKGSVLEVASRTLPRQLEL